MKAIFTLILTLAFSGLLAQSENYLKSWNDPVVQKRIEQGIEQHRKGDIRIKVTDDKGMPLKKYTYEVVQRDHAFLFGANVFMVGGFESADENRLFEKQFNRLFNYASVPFYWKTLEPKQGEVRFEASSSKIYRRPPPDAVVDFCKRNDLIMKGHTLVWENPTHSMPDWAPKDTKELSALIDKRMGQIATRYNEQIKIWDVVNESLQMHSGVVMPDDYVFESFKAAERHMPDAMLLINEVTSQSWEQLKHRNSPYYLQIENLLCRGARIDGIGLQFHFFSEELFRRAVAGEAMLPTTLFHALDLLDDFGKPLHVTEITIPTLPDTESGERIQGVMTENYYRLWFSHPAVEAITWWNMVDDTAVPGEDKWKGGALRRDFSPKPAFDVLDTLINKTWKTTVKGTGTGEAISFRGFYGTYDVVVKSGRKTIRQEIVVKKNGDNEFIIQLKK